MSSWDSIGKLTSELKIKGTNKKVPLYYRCLYDTPCMVGYSIHIDPQDLEANEFSTDTIDEVVTLKSWDKESNSIDTRSMNDSDIYDVFQKWVDPYIEKLETDGLTVRQVLNLLKREGIGANYHGTYNLK